MAFVRTGLRVTGVEIAFVAHGAQRERVVQVGVVLTVDDDPLEVGEVDREGAGLDTTAPQRGHRGGRTAESRLADQESVRSLLSRDAAAGEDGYRKVSGTARDIAVASFFLDTRRAPMFTVGQYNDFRADPPQRLRYRTRPGPSSVREKIYRSDDEHVRRLCDRGPRGARACMVTSTRSGDRIGPDGLASG